MASHSKSSQPTILTIVLILSPFVIRKIIIHPKTMNMGVNLYNRWMRDYLMTLVKIIRVCSETKRSI